jgi:subtilisin family serine protease
MSVPPSDYRWQFNPDNLDRTVIAIPLLNDLKQEEQKETEEAKEGESFTPKSFDLIIDLNLDYKGGRDKAKALVQKWIRELAGQDAIYKAKTRLSNQYVFAQLHRAQIIALAQLNQAKKTPMQRPIYRIWPDFEVRALLTRSVATVKADAARISYSAQGEGIVWAIMDSGIQADHPHFAKYGNLKDLPLPLEHCDFSTPQGNEQSALVDDFGHGTHVAGIVAGEAVSNDTTKIYSAVRQRDENGNVTRRVDVLPAISGVAPKCKLLSLKVLNESGIGKASNLITAIAAIQEINGYGRRLLVHGVNVSVGYDFDPEWFACGQSPLCVEVDRLVRSGVVVVVAAGNTGYGYIQTTSSSAASRAGIDLTINDPGNADLAITVGSTHRDMPHVYGVSYFSSKGPTGDGRLKPDLVAPGEKIISCAAGGKRNALKNTGNDAEYLEDSGTSMAAPHVSGAIAAFLSIRREFISRPEEVKRIFLSTATDLKREKYFQGHGLVDLMRAIQSV